MAGKANVSKVHEPDWAPDDTTPRNHHRLAGLEPDNLLAFMALLGLLRAVETARPNWRPRAFWDIETHPWRPILTLAEPHTEATIAAVAVKGVQELSLAHFATGTAKDLRFAGSDFLELREIAGEEGRQVLDALACDTVLRTDGTLWPTPFAFMFGQGHQHFLDRFRSVPASVSKEGGWDGRSDHGTAALAAALFAPWRRADKADGFRWDPAEDRRYALRARAPSSDAATTEGGANPLGAIALPLFPLTPVRRRGAARVLAPTTFYDSRGDITFAWPIWTVPATLAAVLALLRHPELANERPELGKLPQVCAILRANRISVGKYFNVTPAVRVA